MRKILGILILCILLSSICTAQFGYYSPSYPMNTIGPGWYGQIYYFDYNYYATTYYNVNGYYYINSFRYR